MTKRVPADYPPVDGAPVLRNAEFYSSRALFEVDSALAWFRGAQRKLLAGRVKEKGARYVDIRNRPWASDLPLSRQLRHAIQSSKKNLAADDVPPMHWKGSVHMKDPFSLAAYPLIIQELRPRTIIEIGSYHGGSALWMADLLDVFEIEGGRVVSFDHDLSRITVTDPRVTFLRADSNQVEEFPAELLSTLPHPWLLIEDAHVNVFNVLDHFDRFLTPEDYVIVEDTQWAEFYSDLKRFLLDRDGRYLVDTKYADLFGYNVTWHINGFLRKVR